MGDFDFWPRCAWNEFGTNFLLLLHGSARDVCEAMFRLCLLDSFPSPVAHVSSSVRPQQCFTQNMCEMTFSNCGFSARGLTVKRGSSSCSSQFPALLLDISFTFSASGLDGTGALCEHRLQPLFSKTVSISTSFNGARAMVQLQFFIPV